MNPNRTSWAWAATRLALMAAALIGCGGGVGTGGTGTFTYGPVTGFGSVIVSGVRFDDSQARIEDDEGGGRTRETLKLGTMVAIESSPVTTGATGREATASVVRVGSVLIGPVTSINLAASTLVAIGQTVRVVPTTVIDDALGGLAALGVGRVIEVHGFVDAASQSIVATRIEAPSTPSALYKVRGSVTALDSVGRTLRIGAATFDYANAIGVPGDLANGQLITVRVQTMPGAARWVVSSFAGIRLSQPDGVRDEVDIRGIVTSLVSSARFVLNDTPVDASSARFPDGTAGLVVGARVKAEGRFEGGTLMASEVEIDSDDRLNVEGIDLRGAIESVSPSTSTFRLRGSTVFYGASSVRFDNGTAADLAVGRQVRVRGVVSADRTRVQALRIEF